LQHLRHNAQSPDQPKQQYDANLKVREWTPPGGAVVRNSDIPENAPMWWHGDEDASQSFFTAMGVITGG
jgi:hypothetical protein